MTDRIIRKFLGILGKSNSPVDYCDWGSKARSVFAEANRESASPQRGSDSDRDVGTIPFAHPNQRLMILFVLHS
jgi:hypothetical protein